jgi:hypothetical protein
MPFLPDRGKRIRNGTGAGTMAKKRAEMRTGDVAGRWQTPRMLELNEQVGERIDEIRSQLAKKPIRRVVEFAARCALRTRGLETPGPKLSPDAARVLAEELEEAWWIGIHAARETSKERLAQLGDMATLLRQAGQGTDEEFHGTDDESLGILELRRTSVRLLKCVRTYAQGDEKEARQAAASCAAHSVMAVACRKAADRDQIESAVRRDLEEFPENDASFPPTWDSTPPKWSHSADIETANWLSKNKEHVHNRYVSRIKQNLKEPGSGPEVAKTDAGSLDGASLPSRKGIITGESIDVDLKAANLDVATLQRQQLAAVQKLLNNLTGKSKSSYEENRELALAVSKLVASVGGVLLFNGEFVDNRGKTKSYTNQAVNIRCDEPKAQSFRLRTADRAQSYVASSTVWPKLSVIAKDPIGADAAENQN